MQYCFVTLLPVISGRKVLNDKHSSLFAMSIGEEKSITI
jgi:hypothetical protein